MKETDLGVIQDMGSSPVLGKLFNFSKPVLLNNSPHLLADSDAWKMEPGSLQNQLFNPHKPSSLLIP